MMHVSEIEYVVVCFQGNNERAIKALDGGRHGYMTFEMALQCAKDKHLHPSFRSKYVELIKGQHMWYIIAPLITSFSYAPQTCT